MFGNGIRFVWFPDGAQQEEVAAPVALAARMHLSEDKRKPRLQDRTGVSRKISGLLILLEKMREKLCDAVIRELVIAVVAEVLE